MLLISSISSASRTPDRLSGMKRSIHQAFMAARSAIPLHTGTPIGRCSGAYTVPIFYIMPVASSNSIFATSIRLCINVHFNHVTSFRIPVFLPPSGTEDSDFKLRGLACSSFLTSIWLASSSTSPSHRYLLYPVLLPCMIVIPLSADGLF